MLNNKWDLVQKILQYDTLDINKIHLTENIPSHPIVLWLIFKQKWDLVEIAFKRGVNIGEYDPKVAAYILDSLSFYGKLNGLKEQIEKNCGFALHEGFYNNETTMNAYKDTSLNVFNLFSDEHIGGRVFTIAKTPEAYFNVLQLLYLCCVAQHDQAVIHPYILLRYYLNVAESAKSHSSFSGVNDILDKAILILKGEVSNVNETNVASYQNNADLVLLDKMEQSEFELCQHIIKYTLFMEFYSVVNMRQQLSSDEIKSIESGFRDIINLSKTVESANMRGSVLEYLDKCEGNMRGLINAVKHRAAGATLG